MSEEKRDINVIAMEVIMNAGDGRDKIDEALAAIAAGDLDQAEALLTEAEGLIVKAHNAQTEVIQSQVSGEDMEYSLLFIHAQDTLMTINTELRMTQKLLPRRVPLGRFHRSQPDRGRLERGRPRPCHLRLCPADHQGDPGHRRTL